MARWEDVLDIQMECHRFLTSPHGVSFGANWFAGSWLDHKDDSDMTGYERFASLEQARASGASWALRTAVEAFNAEPIYIEPDMMTVLESAVQSFRAEPLVETDLITRNGFLVLPRPLWLVPKEGQPAGKHRLNWSIAQWERRSSITDHGPGIALTLWHDQTTPDELDDAAKANGEWQKVRHVTRWLPTHGVVWPFGENHPSPERISGADDVQLQLQAIWRLLNQTIAVKQAARPPRAFLKRAQRASLPREHVTVVRLRRPANPPSGDEPKVVNWTHRWLVGGHWRWQWYRDDASTVPCGHLDNDGRICMATGGRHRQIWISPFVKGPEGLELIAPKARVFVLER